MLLRQQRGRRQHRHLSPILHGNEGGAHRHLGLAKADIAAYDPVHGLAGTQIGDHRGNGGLLIGGFLKGKTRGKGGIVGFAEPESMAGAGRPPRVQIEQFGGGITGLFGGLALDLLPLATAEAVQINYDARIYALKISFLVLAAISLLTVFPAARMPNYVPRDLDPDELYTS